MFRLNLTYILMFAFRRCDPAHGYHVVEGVCFSLGSHDASVHVRNSYRHLAMSSIQRQEEEKYPFISEANLYQGWGVGHLFITGIGESPGQILTDISLAQSKDSVMSPCSKPEGDTRSCVSL